MTLSIHTNIPSLMAQSGASRAYDNIITNVERLSTGKRINSAKDDPSGIGMVARLTNLMGATTSSIKNISTVSTITEVADSTLDTATTMLQRMRELSVLSQNAATTDRSALQSELSGLVGQLDSMSSTTHYNTIRLLDGTFKDQLFQVGPSADDTLTLTLNSIKSDQLGVTNKASISALGNDEAIASGDLKINGTAIGASLSSYDSASSADKTYSAIAKVGAINALQATTGVTAKVNTNELHGTAMVGANDSGTITINGVDISVSSTTDLSSTRTAVATAINNQQGGTGVVATDTQADSTGIKLTAADGRNIVVAFSGITSAATGITSGSHYGGYTLSSSSNITIARGSNSSAATIDNSGLREGAYLTQTAALSSIANQQVAWSSGALTLNGLQIRDTRSADDSLSYWGKDVSSIAKVSAINASSLTTGVTAVADSTRVDGASMSLNSSVTGVITINNVNTASITTSASDSSANRLMVANAINSISGQTGVTAVDTGSDSNGVQLVATDGRNISVKLDSDLDQGNNGSKRTGLNATSTQTNFTGSFTLSSANAIDVDTMSPANFVSQVADIGSTGTYGSVETGMALNLINISTQAGGAAAQAAIDNAINQIGESRSSVGGVQNLLKYKDSNLDQLQVDYAVARSSLEDADFAAETTALARNKLIADAAFSVITQANQMPYVVLKLLE